MWSEDKQQRKNNSNIFFFHDTKLISFRRVQPRDVLNKNRRPHPPTHPIQTFPYFVLTIYFSSLF